MKKIIIANWKMNLSLAESAQLAKQYKKSFSRKNEVVICPDFCSLSAVSNVIKRSAILLGAQDSAAYDKGAYTGEVSPLNLKSISVKYVIIGHSERREQLQENSTLINKKIKTTLASGLIPVLCIGEKLLEKRQGQTKDYLLKELRCSLKGVKIKKANDLLIAYEPVWAISTNKKAVPMFPEEADDVQSFIKKQVKKILGQEVKVLYGGSVKPDNAAGFLSQENINGLLVGAASLKIKDFSAIVTKALNC